MKDTNGFDSTHFRPPEEWLDGDTESCADPEWFFEYSEGILPEPLAAECRKKLAMDPELAARYQGYLRVRDGMKELRSSEGMEALKARILAEVQGSNHKKVSSPGARRPSGRLLAFAASMSIAAAALLFFFVLMKNEDPRPKPNEMGQVPTWKDSAKDRSPVPELEEYEEEKKKGASSLQDRFLSKGGKRASVTPSKALGLKTKKTKNGVSQSKSKKAQGDQGETGFSAKSLDDEDARFGKRGGGGAIADSSKPMGALKKEISLPKVTLLDFTFSLKKKAEKEAILKFLPPPASGKDKDNKTDKPLPSNRPFRQREAEKKREKERVFRVILSRSELIAFVKEMKERGGIMRQVQVPFSSFPESLRKKEEGKDLANRKFAGASQKRKLGKRQGISGRLKTHDGSKDEKKNNRKAGLIPSGDKGSRNKGRRGGPSTPTPSKPFLVKKIAEEKKVFFIRVRFK